jgi:hypothetical protein
LISILEKNMRMAYLADHKEVIPELAKWFHQEWYYLYPNKTIDDIKTAIEERANKDSIPVALVAFEKTELVGTVCLKTHDMDNRLDLSPWLAGLYMAASWREIRRTVYIIEGRRGGCSRLI